MDWGLSASSLMRQREDGDALEEGLALVALQRALFDRRAPAPVLDRYVLLEKIGAGGLGVVFRAYDPDLDRRVALKLLRLRKGSTTGVPDLLEEAKLMAQVSHPNVVTIHDIGTYTERDLGLVATRDSELGIPTEGAFLVMELMERGSLRDVLRRRPEAPELMRMLLAAGRGIAAAHDQGIVHRDFKPANVLVGADGSVRVADFGLARHIARDDDGSGSVGTPAYMAPEQIEGAVADARSDQYAFAVTCWEALCGARPFEGEGPAGSRELPGRAEIQRRVHDVLRRALKADPSQRFADMHAMLRALEGAHGGRRRRILAVGGGLTLVAAIAAGFALHRAPAECTHAGDAMRGVWNEAARDRLSSVFAASEAPFAARSGETVLRTLDAYAQRWTDAARVACEDTHVRHVQSEAALDERRACLDRLRLEMADAMSVMVDPDPSVLANAVQVVHGLGWIDACADPRRDAASRTLPDDPALRRALREVWGGLGRARLLELSGLYTEAMAEARSAREQAQACGDEASFAAAHYRMGSIAARRGDYEESRGLLLQAIQLAEAARDDELVADGWIRLVWVAGAELDDPEGDTWAGFARAALDRLGDDPVREAELVHNLGGLDYRRDRFESALSHYQRTLAAQEELLSEDDPRIARTLNHIANVLLLVDEPARARSFAERSLVMRRDVLGAEHPLVAASLNNIASAHLILDELEEAQATVEQSLRITAGSGLPEEDVAHTLAERITAREAMLAAGIDEDR